MAFCRARAKVEVLHTNVQLYVRVYVTATVFHSRVVYGFSNKDYGYCESARRPLDGTFKALERIMTKTANMGLFTGAKLNHSSGLPLRVYCSRSVGFNAHLLVNGHSANAFNSWFNFHVRKSVNLQAHVRSIIDACGSSYTVAVRPFRLCVGIAYTFKVVGVAQKLLKAVVNEG